MALGAIRIQIPIVTGGILFCVLAVILRLIMSEEGFVPPPGRAGRKPANPLTVSLPILVRIVGRTALEISAQSAVAHYILRVGRRAGLDRI